jgi:hypothetical protein
VGPRAASRRDPTQKPFHGAPEALVEADFGLPSEHPLCLGGVCVVAAHLPAAGCRFADLDVLYAFGGEGGKKPVCQLLHRRLGAGGDLEDLAAHVLDGGREQHGSDEVVHEDEIAGLGAVAVYLQRFSLHGPLDEACDDAVLVAREGSVDVPKAQRDGLYAEGVEVCRAIALARQLARPVGCDGMRGHLFVDGRLGLANDGPAARGEDKASDAGVPGRLEVVERADDVAHAVAPRVLDRWHHPRIRREMNDGVGSPGGAKREVFVRYVAGDQLDLLAGDHRAEPVVRYFDEVPGGSQVLSRPYREVVDDPDAMPSFLHERPDQGRPDKTTAARDQPVHEDRSGEKSPCKLLVPACIPVSLPRVVCRAYLRLTSPPARVSGRKRA